MLWDLSGSLHSVCTFCLSCVLLAKECWSVCLRCDKAMWSVLYLWEPCRWCSAKRERWWANSIECNPACIDGIVHTDMVMVHYGWWLDRNNTVWPALAALVKICVSSGHSIGAGLLTKQHRSWTYRQIPMRHVSTRPCIRQWWTALQKFARHDLELWPASWKCAICTAF